MMNLSSFTVNLNFHSLCQINDLVFSNRHVNQLSSKMCFLIPQFSQGECFSETVLCQIINSQKLQMAVHFSIPEIFTLKRFYKFTKFTGNNQVKPQYFYNEKKKV